MAQIDQTPGIRPRLTIGRRLDIAARRAFPGSVTVLLMALTQAPLRLPLQAALLPAVALISVAFWSLHRPASMPPPLVFLIGLLLDVLGYLPLGIGVLTLLVMHAIAGRCGPLLATAPFSVVWLAFIAVAASAATLIWLLTMLLSFRLLSPAPAVFLAAVAAALYPLLAIPFARAHRTAADTEQA
jgi:rod shape-determining protein MreD